MKPLHKALGSLSIIVFSVVTWWSCRPPNVAHNLESFATSWSKSQPSTAITLRGGGKRLSARQQATAFRILSSLTGPFTVERVQPSAYISGSQGVYIAINSAGRESAIILQGDLIDRTVYVDFEQAFTYACITNYKIQHHANPGSTDVALLHCIPGQLPALNSLDMTMVRLNGTSYHNWDEAVMVLEKNNIR
jgi:hypothetical protein